MKKKTVTLISILAAVCILAAFLIFMKITDVSVSGNAWYTKEEVENLIFSEKYESNSAYAFLNNLIGEKKTIPFIEDYKISFVSPTKVEVIIYEKSIVGYVNYLDNYMYFDKDGIIVDSSVEKLKNIPEITGLSFGSIVLYKPLPVADKKIFDDILNLTQLLTTYSIQADRIDYSGIREATLYIGNKKVILGSNSDMNGKISELSSMLPKLSGLKGTLYLDSYNPNSPNSAFSFKPE